MHLSNHLLAKIPTLIPHAFKSDLRSLIHAFASRWDHDRIVAQWQAEARIMKAAGIPPMRRLARLERREASMMPYLREGASWWDADCYGCHSRCGCSTMGERMHLGIVEKFPIPRECGAK
jgi:hypothetical protein